MRVRNAVITMLATLLLAACVQGSGNVVVQERSVPAFSRVVLNGSGELLLSQANERAVSVEADDNLMQNIRTEVRGDTLYLGLEGPGFSIFRSTGPIRYRVTATGLDGVRVSGSGSVTGGEMATDELDVGVSGSGDIRLEAVAADRLTVAISGSGDIEISGAVDHQEIRISGSGTYRAGDLASNSADLSVSGSGDATLWVAERLDARISGSGEVGYYGAPTVSSSISGSGDVRNLGTR